MVVNAQPQTLRTTCYQCDANCAFDVTLDAAGRAVALEGPECPRGAVQLEHQYHPERLLHPLRRVGARGSGRFEPITWDEALDTIASRLGQTRDVHGPEAVGFFAGYTKEARPYLQRLAHAFGSPNYLTESGCCFSATLAAEKLTYGYRFKSASLLDQEETRCVLVWSTNPPGSVMPFERHHLACHREGRPLIVVDPRRTETARQADLHLQLRPGTDGALALGFHHLIFARGWADEAFLGEWASGVEAFREYVRGFDPDRVAAICGVPAGDIERGAELYATHGPSQIALSPTATVQHSNGFQNHRAVILLAAVTGNVDREGGNRFFFNKVLPRSIDLFERIGDLPPRIGDERFPIWTRYWPAAQSMLLPEAILEGRPTPVRALLAMGIATSMWPNSKRMTRALEALDFFACSDFFHNEATLRADIVLPAATALERDALIAYPGCQFKGEVRYRRAALQPLGEARPDAQMFLDLGCRMVGPEMFWHGDFAASATEQAAGLPEQVRHDAYHNPDGATVFAAHLLDDDLDSADRLYRKRGFPTASGRIEFDSRELRDAGYDGLPVYQEPAESPVSRPDLARDYPLVLTSGGRSRYYTHTQQHNLPSTRCHDPVPRAQIHPQDALARGIHSGDQVQVSSPRGAVVFTAEVTADIKPGVVHCFHGWAEANINELTDDANLDPISGFPPFKSGLCQVAPVVGERCES